MGFELWVPSRRVTTADTNAPLFGTYCHPAPSSDEPERECRDLGILFDDFSALCFGSSPVQRLVRAVPLITQRSVRPKGKSAAVVTPSLTTNHRMVLRKQRQGRPSEELKRRSPSKLSFHEASCFSFKSPVRMVQDSSTFCQTFKSSNSNRRVFFDLPFGFHLPYSPWTRV